MSLRVTTLRNKRMGFDRAKGTNRADRTNTIVPGLDLEGGYAGAKRFGIAEKLRSPRGRLSHRGSRGCSSMKV